MRQGWEVLEERDGYWSGSKATLMSSACQMHHKFAVIDNKKVITGSFNWSPSAAQTNDETLLMVESPQLAAHFTREMDRMWRGAELGITPHIQRKLDRQSIRCRDGMERE